MSTIPSARPTRSRTRVSSICQCLQDLSSLLAYLKETSRIQDPLEPCSVLVAARDALSRWRRHSLCGTCQQKNDEDVLIVFVMGLREMLCLIHRVSRPERQHDRDKTAAISPSELRPAFTPESQEVHVLAPKTERSFLGMYKLSKEEELGAVNILLCRILENINRTTKHIKQRSTRTLGNLSEVHNSATNRVSSYSLGEISSRPQSEDGIASSNAGSTPDKARGHFHQIFNSLGKSIESLQHNLQCSF